MAALIVDNLLLEQARSGDQPALERLMKVHRPDLERYARRHCASDDVEEAVQDALWILYRRLGGLRSMAAFAGWLYQVVRRACLRYAIGRRRDVSLDDLPVGHDRDHGASDIELRTILAGIIASLSPLTGITSTNAFSRSALTTRSPAEADASGARQALSPATLSRVLFEIDSRLGEPLDVPHLADVAGLTRAHFSRAFQQTTGIPPRRFVTIRRVCRARDLLAATDAPLADVAASTGFSSQAHMSTVFRREVGTTPAQYRAAFRGALWRTSLNQA